MSLVFGSSSQLRCISGCYQKQPQFIFCDKDLNCLADGFNVTSASIICDKGYCILEYSLTPDYSIIFYLVILVLGLLKVSGLQNRLPSFKQGFKQKNVKYPIYPGTNKN